MFKQIRKKQNEITLDETKTLLKTSRRGVLSLFGTNGYPYAIPINYYYDESLNRIIFHGSKAGHKVDAIKACDKVCFTVYGPEIVKKEHWAPYVKSAVVFGRCHLIDDINLLKTFARKYYPNDELVENEVEKQAKNVQLFEITIEHISGKEVQEK